MILKVVLLAEKEVVHLGEPRGVHRLGLRSVIAVIFISKISVSGSSILRSINVEVFLLVILDREEIVLRVVTILAEEGLHGGSIHGRGLGVQHSLVTKGETEHAEESPSISIGIERFYSAYSLEAQIE